MFNHDRKLLLIILLDHYGVTPDELNKLDMKKRNVLLQADLAHLKKVFTLIKDPVELFALSDEQFTLLVNRVDEIDVLIDHAFSIDEFKAADPAVIAKWLNLPDELKARLTTETPADIFGVKKTCLQSSPLTSLHH